MFPKVLEISRNNKVAVIREIECLVIFERLTLVVFYCQFNKRFVLQIQFFIVYC